VPKARQTPRQPKRTPSSPARKWFSRRVAILLWCAALLWLAGIILYPVSSECTRGASVILCGLLLLGLLALWWRYRILRWSLLFLYGAGAVFLALPGRTGYDRLALRQETARALHRYEGARYYDGGENAAGIDCSGLVRRGAIDALVLYGIQTGNPLLIRKGLALWWHDMSASELGRGAAGLAEKLFEVKQIAGMNDTNLHPGDFAVENGTHALAYLGNHQWIEADPAQGKTLEWETKDGATHSQASQRAQILRWRHLELGKGR